MPVWRDLAFRFPSMTLAKFFLKRKLRCRARPAVPEGMLRGTFEFNSPIVPSARKPCQKKMQKAKGQHGPFHLSNSEQLAKSYVARMRFSRRGWARVADASRTRPYQISSGFLRLIARLGRDGSTSRLRRTRRRPAPRGGHRQGPGGAARPGRGALA